VLVRDRLSDQAVEERGDVGFISTQLLHLQSV
jgi:hypothetical protein